MIGGGYGISTFSLIALLVSIFNIISLVVNSSSNNNNNDNNSNINDNQGNENGAQNSESNTNNAMMAVTQVMQVPPGAGRRKRAITKDKENDYKSTLIFKNKTLSLAPSHSENINVSLLDDDIDAYFLDEVGIGIILSLNNWHYFNSNTSTSFLPKTCLYRNLCEMNYNCAMFGNGSKLVSTIVSHVIARDFSDSNEEEEMFLTAAKRGSMLNKQCDQWIEIVNIHMLYLYSVKNYIFYLYD